MSNYKKVIIISVSLIAVLLLIGVVVMVGIGKEKAKEVPRLQEQQKSTLEDPQEEFTLYSVEYVTGFIEPLSDKIIEVTREDGEKMTLKIPPSEVSFVKQVKLENNEIFLEEIGLYNIPKDQKADIQYNPETRIVRLIEFK